nr:immunoglobulin light chain junction region [Macaca mulatta]MOV74767.1 immunoglobulin light chain junction region [Macaca mulatta]MOV75014.1 immunoglobulin light chain junction region [Macaca mulatta]MOV75202.1 immunoglobulin light chain junction region [Macaca mulatta]MOV77338.1 immunoglobulin light chain junction region [Macaca mulatta]
CQQGYKIPYSF